MNCSVPGCNKPATYTLKVKCYCKEHYEKEQYKPAVYVPNYHRRD